MHGVSIEVYSVKEALKYEENSSEKYKFIKYEYRVIYSNGEKYECEFNSKAKLIQTLHIIV